MGDIGLLRVKALFPQGKRHCFNKTSFAQLGIAHSLEEDVKFPLGENTFTLDYLPLPNGRRTITQKGSHSPIGRSTKS